MTAWSPNAEDIDVFFMGLPQGEYGVAFYDADEYDGYESISVFSGLHHGCATLHAAEGDCESGTIEMDVLKARRDNYFEIEEVAHAAVVYERLEAGLAANPLGTLNGNGLLCELVAQLDFELSAEDPCSRERRGM